MLATAGCGPGKTAAPAPARPDDAGSKSVPKPVAPALTLSADDPCAAETAVEDFGTWTLLVSPTRARRVEPGRPLAQAVEMGADLPAGRGASHVFATRPAMLRVEAHPRARMEQGTPHRLFRLAGGRWIELQAELGELSAVLPIETAAVPGLRHLHFRFSRSSVY